MQITSSRKYRQKCTFETLEDIVLGYLAKERFEKTKKSRYISHEEAVKKLKFHESIRPSEKA